MKVKSESEVAQLYPTLSDPMDCSLPVLDDGGISGLFSSGGPSVRFLTRYDGEVSEPLVGRQGWQPTPVFLPGESQGRGSLVGCHLWGRTESDTTEAT